MQHTLKFHINLNWTIHNAREIDWIISHLDYECHI
jgi:hypothetical protein